jgi:hypothetical protein
MMVFADAGDAGAALGGLLCMFVFAAIFFIVALLVYFSPTILALMRSHSDVLAIILVNLLFGWTVVGWIYALIWSLTGTKNQSIVVNQQVSSGGPQAFVHRDR